MQATDAVNILNELLSGEVQSLLPRLRESSVFVSWASTDEMELVYRMIAEDAEHESWLADAIFDLGGAPLPATRDIRSTNIHYSELKTLLPLVLADRQRMLRLYESAAGMVAHNPRAAETISRITDRLRKHVDLLTKLKGRANADATPS